MSSEEDINEIALFVQKYIAGHNNLSPDDRLLLVLDKLRIFALLAPTLVQGEHPNASPDTIRNVSNTSHYVESYLDALYHEMMGMLYNRDCEGCPDCDDFDEDLDASEPSPGDRPVTPIADSDIQGSKYLSNLDKVEQLPDWNSWSDVESDVPSKGIDDSAGERCKVCSMEYCCAPARECVPTKTSNMSSLCSYGSNSDNEYDSTESNE